MNTGVKRWTWSAITIAALVWAATCRGQGLEIDIPVPEPEKTAADGKEAAKRKAPQRRESAPSARRAARQQPGEAAPATSHADPSAPPASQRASTHEPTLALPSVREPRAGAIGEAESAPLPPWANPAAIPLRQQDRTLAGPAPEPLEDQAAASSPPGRRGPASRAAGSAHGSPGRSGGRGHKALAARRQQQPDPTDSTSLLARRHRTPSRDPIPDSPAPPSPWGSNR